LSRNIATDAAAGAIRDIESDGKARTAPRQRRRLPQRGDQRQPIVVVIALTVAVAIRPVVAAVPVVRPIVIPVAIRAIVAIRLVIRPVIVTAVAIWAIIAAVVVWPVVMAVRVDA
jgi:hypothetical protein